MDISWVVPTVIGGVTIAGNVGAWAVLANMQNENIKSLTDAMQKDTDEKIGQLEKRIDDKLKAVLDRIEDQINRVQTSFETLAGSFNNVSIGFDTKVDTYNTRIISEISDIRKELASVTSLERAHNLLEQTFLRFIDEQRGTVNRIQEEHKQSIQRVHERIDGVVKGD